MTVDARRWGDMTLAQVLAARRSVREYTGAPISRAALERLLWAANGSSDGKRSVPSAGALHAVSVRVVVGRVQGLDTGVYCYDPSGGALHRIVAEEARGALCAAAIEDQPWLGDAAAVIAWAADFDSVVEHYAGQPPPGRGERYLWLEAGCSVQNVYLQATALGLGGVFVGAFDDVRVGATLGLSPNERVMGLFALGVPRADDAR